MKGLADWIYLLLKVFLIIDHIWHDSRTVSCLAPTIFPGHALPSALIGGKHYSIKDSKNRAGHDDVRCE